MKKIDYLVLFIFEIVIILLVGLFQKSPGYMDAEYYYSGGIRLAEGYGFSEEFLWNYLDDPQGIPHPSHGYWMPLASILAAAGMFVGNRISFEFGRLAFVIIAGIIPPLTAMLGYQINQRRDYAIISGFLAGMPAFYLSYLGTTDTFGLNMALGGLFVWLIGMDVSQLSRGRRGLFFLGLGILAGLMHLSRVDGILWLGMIAIYIAIMWFKNLREKTNKSGITPFIYDFGIGILGYLLIMGPWMVRNYLEFDSLFSPGGTKSLWITSYDELYAYPSSILDFNHWVNSGWMNIIKARSWAGWNNIQSTIVVEGEIFLAPLMVWGIWKNRQLIQVKVACIAWLLIFLTMTLIFPYQGARGGFFHSTAAIQPLLWALAPVGLNEFVLWGKKFRHWNYSQAKTFFQWGILGLACFLSIVMVSKRVIGGNFSNPEWNKGYITYMQLEKKIREVASASDEIVMVNNPPGYYLASFRPCIAIPNGSLEQVMDAAHRYNAKYIILEANHPEGVKNLYDKPGNRSGLKYLFSFEGAYFYQIESGG